MNNHISPLVLRLCTPVWLRQASNVVDDNTLIITHCSSSSSKVINLPSVQLSTRIRSCILSLPIGVDYGVLALAGRE